MIIAPFVSGAKKPITVPVPMVVVVAISGSPGTHEATTVETSEKAPKPYIFRARTLNW